MKRTDAVSKRISVLLIITVLFLLLTALNSINVAAAAVTLTISGSSVSSAAPGASITVNGSGYAANETGIAISFDGSTVASNITASAAGAWTGYFTVPNSPSGYVHQIYANGSTTPFGPIAFTIIPMISLGKTSGSPNSSVNVNGYGFAANETGIKIVYDSGTTLVTGITAVSNGTWSKAFTVPSDGAGPHSITASGSSTTSVTAVTFTIIGGISLSKTSGTPQTPVNITGAGFAANETNIVVTFDGNQVASAVSADSSGNWTARFNIPLSPSGTHLVGAYGSVTSAGSVQGVAFNTIAGISANKSSGPPGSSITINGTGFAAGETGISITFDDSLIVSDIVANSNGSWSKSFVVPASNAGSHIIVASGSSSTASQISFTTGAAISLNRSSGTPGMSISATGAGFSDNETGIIVIFDGNTVASEISADSNGSWTAAFTVPPSASGSHSIAASGLITKANSVPVLRFNTVAVISINKDTASPSSPVTMTGSGFASNETGIKITFDGTPLASDISADNNGSWTNTFSIPPAVFGPHTFAASGSTTTLTAATRSSINITTGIVLSPPAGYVGSSVSISGIGFAPNSSVRISYDGNEIAVPGAMTDAVGNLNQSITVPVSMAGIHNIMAIDSQGNSVKTSFSISSTPPSVPAGVSPSDGSTISITGNITPNFKWTDVSSSDPNGVSYNLQVDTSPDFSEPVVNRTDIQTNHYTLKPSEALARGQYYWRVKAVDAASNESAWSDAYSLKSGVMALWLLVLIIILIVAAAGVGIYFLVARILSGKHEAITVSEVEVPSASPGQYQALESGEAVKEHESIRRMALPEVSKTAKTLSTEDQARLKVIMDFARSMPLIEPEYDTKWLIDLVENQAQAQLLPSDYEKLLKGELQPHYNPAWKNHPVYKEMASMLQKQPVLQKLDAFINDTSRTAMDAASLIQAIYHESAPEIPVEFIERGGWSYVSAVYTDVVNWYAGKSLHDPSERDYLFEPVKVGDQSDTGRWLSGSAATSFAGHLISTRDEQEAIQLRTLHMKLRRTWRSDEKARQVTGAITRLQLQRNELLTALSQFGRTR